MDKQGYFDAHETELMEASAEKRADESEPKLTKPSEIKSDIDQAIEANRNLLADMMALRQRMELVHELIAAVTSGVKHGSHTAQSESGNYVLPSCAWNRITDAALAVCGGS